MASWIRCECGKALPKNLFSGNGVRIVVPEETFERDFDGVTAYALAGQLVGKDILLECGSCGRILIVDERGQRETRVYRPDPGGEDPPGETD